MKVNRIFQKCSRKTKDALRRIIAPESGEGKSLKQSFTVTGKLGTVDLFSLALPILVQTAVTHLTGFVNSAVLS